MQLAVGGMTLHAPSFPAEHTAAFILQLHNRIHSLPNSFMLNIPVLWRRIIQFAKHDSDQHLFEDNFDGILLNDHPVNRLAKNRHYQHAVMISGHHLLY